MFLDTTVCIDLMREQLQRDRGPATTRIAALSSLPIYLPVFCLCELLAGVRLSRRPERERQRVERFAGLVDVVYPDRAFADAYAESEAILRRRGRPIPTMDLMIGALVVASGGCLLTRDKAHFEGIPGLAVETY